MNFYRERHKRREIGIAMEFTFSLEKSVLVILRKPNRGRGRLYQRGEDAKSKVFISSVSIG